MSGRRYGAPSNNGGRNEPSFWIIAQILTMSQYTSPPYLLE
jgi:hypothetical protein